jgi:hypothetical protein
MRYQNSSSGEARQQPRRVVKLLTVKQLAFEFDRPPRYVRRALRKGWPDRPAWAAWQWSSEREQREVRAFLRKYWEDVR